ncbi:MAG: hypothetical protein WA970_25605 [Gammaproteobacteria bacterium]
MGRGTLGQGRKGLDLRLLAAACNGQEHCGQQQTAVAVSCGAFLDGPGLFNAEIMDPGRSFRVLPPLTVDFSGLPQGLAPILAYL